MPKYATRIETRLGMQLDPEQIFQHQSRREICLSRMLMLYVATGLIFMLLPGTFLGVWNLISISSRHAAMSVAPAWVQAHGHAQIFGWIGTFILGIGYYSLPKLRRLEPFALAVCSATWALWTVGVALRWIANVYLWHWRTLLPLSALLELAACALFFHSVSGHRAPVQTPGEAPLQPWVLVVIAGTIGFLGMLIANVGGAVYASFKGISPAFPAEFDQRYLALCAWGFMVPFVWGFSAKWLPVFLGLKAPYSRLLLVAASLNGAGVIAALAGTRLAVALSLVAAALSGFALRLFEPPQQPAKIRSVYRHFPSFVRLAYIWLLVAGGLGIWAAATDSAGVWGASRHALTAGFVATMVFCVGQRILPAFSGMRLLFSSRMMAAGLILLAAGCFVRVLSEVLAYQGLSTSAWKWLPVSAVVELTAVTIFAFNLLATFAQSPAAGQDA